MIQLTFKKDRKGQFLCCEEENGIHFLLNDGRKYENRACILQEDGFVFDGYSTWFEGTQEKGDFTGDFTISFFFASPDLFLAVVCTSLSLNLQWKSSFNLFNLHVIHHPLFFCFME